MIYQSFREGSPRDLPVVKSNSLAECIEKTVRYLYGPFEYYTGEFIVLDTTTEQIVHTGNRHDEELYVNNDKSYERHFMGSE